MNDEKLEIKKSIIVNILLIIGIVLTVWNPVLGNIQINFIPTIMFLIAYLKKDSILQVFLNGAILGLCAVTLDNFILLLSVKFSTMLTLLILINLLRKKKNLVLKSGFIVFVSTLINGFIFSFIINLPCLHQVLTIVVTGAIINALMVMLIIFIYNIIIKVRRG